jgi:hypothetical protein
MSPSGPKAEVTPSCFDVCSYPASRHFQALDARRLWAKSRHLANSCVLSLDDYRTIIDERELRFYGNSRNNVLKLARHLIPGLFLRLVRRSIVASKNPSSAFHCAWPGAMATRAVIIAWPSSASARASGILPSRS